MIDRFKRLVIRELKYEYPDVDFFDDTDLIECMQDIYAQRSRHLLLLLMSGTVFSVSISKIKMPRKSILTFYGIY